MNRREKLRDDRDFDTTALRSGGHGASLTRDYSAHFFRWSFARRFIKPTDDVLEVGCGVERPLWRVLFTAAAVPLARSYVGVDLNALPAWEHARSAFHGGFDFTTRWRELKPDGGKRGYDVVVSFEVLEHMLVRHGRKLLAGVRELLAPGGAFLLSTPCYDGVRHAANHIHEYTIEELSNEFARAGFVVERRFGTFMDVKHLKRLPSDAQDVARRLAEYYDNSAVSCIFAPLLPDYSRNNLWVLRKSEER